MMDFKNKGLLMLRLLQIPLTVIKKYKYDNVVMVSNEDGTISDVTLEEEKMLNQFHQKYQDLSVYHIIKTVIESNVEYSLLVVTTDNACIIKAKHYLIENKVLVYSLANDKLEYIDDVEFKRIIKDIYDTGSDRFIEWQDNFRKCVDFVYNLNGNEELKEEDKLAKFVAFTIKDNDFYTYSQGIEIITDTYINIHNKYHNETLNNLIDRIKNKDQELELHNVYTSKNLTSICFAVLDKIVRQENLQIKTCLNYGRYFIPNYRQNEIYCDLANVDQSPTCKDKGANEQYKKNLEKNKAQALYRRIYRQKFMIAQRNKDSKIIQKEFEQWKKDAKDKVNKMKKDKLTEDEVFKWLVENK